METQKLFDPVQVDAWHKTMANVMKEKKEMRELVLRPVIERIVQELRARKRRLIFVSAGCLVAASIILLASLFLGCWAGVLSERDTLDLIDNQLGGYVLTKKPSATTRAPIGVRKNMTEEDATCLGFNLSNTARPRPVYIELMAKILATFGAVLLFKGICAGLSIYGADRKLKENEKPRATKSVEHADDDEQNEQDADQMLAKLLSKGTEYGADIVADGCV